MVKIIKKLMISKSGEGLVSSLLWLAVTAIVSGAIAYSVWAAMGTSATTVKGLITNTIH